MNTTTDTQAAVNSSRNALFAREAAGQTVTEAEWIAIGDRQIALDRGKWLSNGYMAGI